jgi:hypothetical protein
MTKFCSVMQTPLEISLASQLLARTGNSLFGRTLSRTFLAQPVNNISGRNSTRRLMILP